MSEVETLRKIDFYLREIEIMRRKRETGKPMRLYIQKAREELYEYTEQVRANTERSNGGSRDFPSIEEPEVRELGAGTDSDALES